MNVFWDFVGVMLFLSNVGPQAWKQEPLLSESSHWSLIQIIVKVLKGHCCSVSLGLDVAYHHQHTKLYPNSFKRILRVFSCLSLQSQGAETLLTTFR